MLIGSASRYIGGRRAVQTVYWRASRKDEKLVKTGRSFNLTKPSGEETAKVRSRYADSITSFGKSKPGASFI